MKNEKSQYTVIQKLVQTGSNHKHYRATRVMTLNTVTFGSPIIYHRKLFKTIKRYYFYSFN